MSQGQRVYITNNRIAVFDQNTEEIRKILQDASGTQITVADISGYFNELIDVTIASQEVLFDICANGDTSNIKLRTLVETQLSTNPTIYDFVLNSAQVSVGDSRFRIDPNGRNGWLFSNDTAPTTGSSLYWYSNQVPPFGSGIQSDIYYNDVETFYCVVTTNAVASADDLPIMGIYSFPTGSGDGNPAFYHSRWVFTTTSSDKRYAFEKVLYYYGVNPNIYPELRHVQLTLSNVAPTGPRTNDVLYLMSLNTTSGRTANAVNYIAHATGFHLVNGHKREFQFDNSKKRLAETTFSELDVSGGLLQVGGSLSVAFPTIIDVSGAVDVRNFPALQDISGSVDVRNFPALQDISGSVDVRNFPALQDISGAVDVRNFPALQDISGSVDVRNFPALQDISGSVDVRNFPALQDISGSVTVLNFPVVQDVSNTNLNALSFTTDKGVNYLNTNSTFGFPTMNDTLKASLWESSNGFAISSTNPLPVKIMGTPATTFAWTLADFTPNDGTVGAVSPSIQADLYNKLTCFGNHTGTGGTHRLTYEFSLDDITYYDTTFVITLPNATPFNDTNSLGIPYVRFKLTSNPFTSLVLNVAVK
jgi:hypothetical protein